MRSLGHRPFFRNPYAVDNTAFLRSSYDQVSVTFCELTINKAGLFGVTSAKDNAYAAKLKKAGQRG